MPRISSQRNRRNRNNASGVKGLYLKKGHYVFQPPMVDGVRPPAVHLGTDSLAEALAQVEQLREVAFVHSQTQPLERLVTTFLEAKLALGEHKSRKTSLSARPGLDRFARFFAGRQPQSLDAADIRRWKAAMLEEGLSRASVAGYLRYAQSFCSWLIREGRMLRNPFAQKGLFPKSIPTRRDQACTKDLRDRLCRECPDPAIQAALYLGFFAGLRRREILALRPEWIEVDEDNRPIYIHIQNDPTAGFHIKDNEPKRVPVSRTLADFLLGYGLDHAPYLIRPDCLPGKAEYRYDWKGKWRRYMASQGCPWVTPHTMRHTWFTLLLSAPSGERPSLLHLSRWSGTEPDTIKKHYAHLLEDRELIDVAD